jgi:hypothetical protein
MATLSERLGLRKASGVGEAGWGHTLLVAIISFIYFIPVLFILFTAIKPQDAALSVPPTPLLLQLYRHRICIRLVGPCHRHARRIRLLALSTEG